MDHWVGPFWSQPIHDAAWVKGVLEILEVTETSLSLPCSCRSPDMWEVTSLLIEHLQQTSGVRQRHALPSQSTWFSGGTVLSAQEDAA